MSKVAIQGNASGTGTFTIAAPNSNTDRTLTLPDEAGTVLSSGTPLSSFPSGFANGITEADQWRLTASFGSNGVIDSNWERVAEQLNFYIGSGMTESSGVFTFPSTGKWLIFGECVVSAIAGDQFNFYIEQSRNGGDSFDTHMYSNNYVQSGGIHGSKLSGMCLMDVTNTSTHLVRAALGSVASGSVVIGNTAQTMTGITFIRLGDT
jgi:hypothetical protein